MADEENIIDRGEADVTAFDLLNINEPTPFLEKLERTYDLEDKISHIDPTSVVPGVISALTTDTLGAINVLNPLYAGEGESEDYGAWDYFSDVFGGAISGEVPKGEMFISNEDINANPNLKEWLENTQKIMQQNASEQIHEFAKDKRLMDDAAFQQYYDDLAAKDPDMKLPETKCLNKIMTQFHEPQPYEIDTPNNGIIIKENLLPEISRDVDPKFTKDGDLSLPYAGKFGYNDAGEFVMKRPSMFRFTDELTRGKEGPAWLEATEDYLYPNINARFSYGDTGPESAGYMIGQFAPGIKGLINLGIGGVKKGKGIINYLRGKSGVNPNINLSKIEPHFKNAGIDSLGVTLPLPFDK